MNSVWFVVPLTLSMVAGIIIGYINQRKTGIGGARTFALICCGATLVTLVSRYFFIGLGRPWFADPGRISAQIIPALVFLALGIVLFTETRSQEVEVGTNLWVAALVGMMLGSDLSLRSLLVIGFVFLVYRVLDKLETILPRRISSRARTKQKAESANDFQDSTSD